MLEYRTIKDFSNYLIGNNGEVYNKQTNHCKIPTSNKTGKGYLYVDLYNGNKHARKYIHRLVAETYIPNPQNKPYVNHIDGNPHNNLVENLEWCTPLENVEHASKIIKTMQQYKIANEHRKRKVKMINKDSGLEIAIFESISEASKQTGVHGSNIVACLKGRLSYTKDYIWQYIEDLGEEE